MNWFEGGEIIEIVDLISRILSTKKLLNISAVSRFEIAIFLSNINAFRIGFLLCLIKDLRIFTESWDKLSMLSLYNSDFVVFYKFSTSLSKLICIDCSSWVLLSDYFWNLYDLLLLSCPSPLLFMSNHTKATNWLFKREMKLCFDNLLMLLVILRYISSISLELIQIDNWKIFIKNFEVFWLKCV